MERALNLVKSSLLVSLVASMLFLGGCKPKLLPNTSVRGSAQNKEIIAFLEQYKAAIEKRSVDAVMEFIAKDFKDNMGTEDPRHYLDYLSLKEKLEKNFPRIQDLRMGIFVQHIDRIDKDTYEIVFYYNKHLLTETPSGDKWIPVKEVSRMIIRRRHDKGAPYKFEILQGV